MTGPGAVGDRDGEQDLVVVTIRGVQRFIAESRSTADLHAGSALMSELAGAMAEAARNFEPRPDVIMPSEAARASIPNRVAVRIAAGHGGDLAKCMADAANEEWRKRELSVQPEAEVTPGFPDVQWVVADPDPRGYSSQWETASQALTARKRISSFTFPPVSQTRICSLTGRWRALQPGPEGGNVRDDEALSLPSHVKRAFSRDRRQPRFPSTWSIATAQYRSAIIERAAGDEELQSAVSELHGWIDILLSECGTEDRDKLERRSAAVPGVPARTGDKDLDWLAVVEGSWCSPWTWEPGALRRDYELDVLPDAAGCKEIAGAAAKLAKAAADRDIPPLTGYLTVIAQDADHMGARLSEFPGGTDPAAWHKKVSAALAEAGQRQRDAVGARNLFANVVYAGGDDLLALAPAATALSVVRTAGSVFEEVVARNFTEDPATVSTAIACFDAGWPLQSAIAAAQALLKQTKENHRPGLGVSVLRGGGERNRLILPWTDRSGTAMITHLETLTASMAGVSAGLSGRLASELERDRDALQTLDRDWLALELARRCERHGGASVADALIGLGNEDANGRLTVPDQAVTIARFLAGEAGAADPGTAS